MNEDGPLIWLQRSWDGLALALLAALAASSSVGFMKGAKGAAFLVSHIFASLLTVIAYPLILDRGYSWQMAVPVCAVIGGCSVAVLRLLVALSDAIDRRRDKIANKLLDRAEGGT